MIWHKYTIETTTEAADIVASVLFDNDIVGAEIEDNTNLTDEELKLMYVDIPALKVDDGRALVSFYVCIDGVDGSQNSPLREVVSLQSSPECFVDNSYTPSTDNIFNREDFDKKLNEIKNSLNEYKSFMNMGTLNISISELDDNIFLNKWKENFKRFEIDDISVIPSWEKNCRKDGDHINIYIEPGNAFGTGKHATTKLCALAIKDLINNKSINLDDSALLDIGCGSGILAILGIKLGIKNVMAIDVDENIRLNLIENCKLNDIECYDKDFEKHKNEFKYFIGNIIDDENTKNKVGAYKYDIVVANILAPVIISLVTIGKVDKYIKNGGYFICSGIIKDMREKVIDAIKSNHNLSYICYNEEDDWVSIIAKKK